MLPDGESNPGLPRDRRGYLPLYYRGDALCRTILIIALLSASVTAWRLLINKYTLSRAWRHHFPSGLVVRIPRSHRGGRGSIPRLGNISFCIQVSFSAPNISVERASPMSRKCHAPLCCGKHSLTQTREACLSDVTFNLRKLECVIIP
jgi:hypothetical protein